MCACMHGYVNARVCAHMSVHVHGYACIVAMCACMYMCSYVGMSVNVCTCVYMYECACTCRWVHMWGCAHVGGVHVWMGVHAWVRSVYMCVCM